MRSFFLALYKIAFFRRLVPSILRRLPFSNSVNTKIENFEINLNLGSSIDRYIYLHSFYDRDKISFLENKFDLNEFRYFLDIGSNIGFYSLYFASRYKNLNILSFEPIIDNFDQINRSIKLNNYHTIDTYNYALSNSQEDKIMWVTDLNKKGGFSIYEEEDFKHEIHSNNYDEDKLSKTNVQSKIFDENFQISNEKILIKIDVERHELFCLEGMKQLLKESNNKIFIQVEITNYYKDQVFKILDDYGFKLIHTISPDKKNESYGLDYYFTNFT